MSVKAHEFGKWKGPMGNVHTLSDLSGSIGKKISSAIRPAQVQPTIVPTRPQSLCSWKFIKPILLALGLILASLVSLVIIVNSGVVLSGSIGFALTLQVLLLAAGLSWLFMHIRIGWKESRS
ncbi:hypothetical protein [Chlamydia sp. 17-3921]|uniref:hypothetical protein n=1 Tax=Chlamydia sp. 17-3921 TaxID=2675798 RepID=UPI001918A67B|nr:hypothetical protein [Chlamydia sp. 17-3921]